MTDLVLPRRRFLTGLVGLIAAPAIVRASSLMPVKAIEEPVFFQGVQIFTDNAALVFPHNSVFFQGRYFWISGEQEISYSAVGEMPPVAQAS